ncbi:MAG: DUF177 domain-containing protein [Dehalococcoidia bacterium]|nr:DUF177 domain-containing protein [Dehalococcoidia bacterium]
MIFNVAGLLKGTSGGAKKYSLEGEELSSEEQGSFELISGMITLMRTDRTIMVTGRLAAVTHRTCSRCLEPAVLNLEAEIEEEYHPANTDLGGTQRDSRFEEDSLDPVLLIDDRNDLDLSQVVLELLAGAMPIAPLCQPECRGLCPVCWKDRNKTPCHCRQNTSDPRLAGLAELGSLKAHSADN